MSAQTFGKKTLSRRKALEWFRIALYVGTPFACVYLYNVPSINKLILERYQPGLNIPRGENEAYNRMKKELMEDLRIRKEANIAAHTAALQAHQQPQQHQP